MGLATRRWENDAVLERLAAEQAIDTLPRTEIATRAQFRLRLTELASEVDRGDLSSSTAAKEFRSIRSAVASRLDAARL